MDQSQLNGLTNFIWNIANGFPHDVCLSGNCRNVILLVTELTEGSTA